MNPRSRRDGIGCWLVRPLRSRRRPFQRQGILADDEKAGDFKILVAGSSDNIQLRSAFTLTHEGNYFQLKVATAWAGSV